MRNRRLAKKKRLARDAEEIMRRLREPPKNRAERGLDDAMARLSAEIDDEIFRKLKDEHEKTILLRN